MRPGIIVTVSRVDRRRLEALARNRNAAQKHVWRAQIVLLSADAGLPDGNRYTDAAKATDRAAWQVVTRHASDKNVGGAPLRAAS
jgi:hypothetical protein